MNALNYWANFSGFSCEVWNGCVSAGRAGFARVGLNDG